MAPLNRAFDVAMTGTGAGDEGDMKWQDASLDALSTARAADHLLREVLTTNDTSLAPGTALPELQEKLTRLSTEMKALQKK